MFSADGVPGYPLCLRIWPLPQLEGNACIPIFLFLLTIYSSYTCLKYFVTENNLIKQFLLTISVF